MQLFHQWLSVLFSLSVRSRCVFKRLEEELKTVNAQLRKEQEGRGQQEEELTALREAQGKQHEELEEEHAKVGEKKQK